MHVGASGDAPRIVGKPIIAGDNAIYRIDKLIPLQADAFIEPRLLGQGA
jgi:hypothetical protein